MRKSTEIGKSGKYKRCLTLCLPCLLMICMLLSGRARAAGTLPLIVSVSPDKAEIGDTVEITVSLGDCTGTDLGAMQFDLVLPSGLKYQSYVMPDTVKTTIGAQLVAFNPDNLRFAFAGTDTGYNGASQLALITVKCKVESSAALPIGLSEVSACTVDAQELATFVTAAVLNGGQAGTDDSGQTQPSPGEGGIAGTPDADPGEIISNPGAVPFDDIAQSAWYYSDVAYVYEKGLFAGTGDNKFSPETPMSRAMIATVLYRLAGSPAVSGDSGFSDVAGGQWYSNAILWAETNGIVSGVGDNRFNPEGNITRQDFTVLLDRYVQISGVSLPKVEPPQTFADDRDIASYAKGSLYAMQECGIINGKPGNMADPQGRATRAEVAAMLHRFASAIAG